MNQKIVVLTGSFNPVTKAHYAILHGAVDALGADQGMFIATGHAYLLKKTRDKPRDRTPFLLDEDTRKAMLSSLSEYDPRLSFWGFELGGASSSTEKTLRKVAKQHPGATIYYLCGADKLHSIPKWHNIDSMFDFIYLAVYDRGDVDVEGLLDNDPFYKRHRDRVSILPANEGMLGISSTEIRRRFFAGEDYQDLMSPSCYNILKNYKPSDFPPLTAEMIAETKIRYGGQFGKGGARSLIFKENCRLFASWDETRFGKKEDFLQGTIVYDKPFQVGSSRTYSTVFECRNEDCADTALNLIHEGYVPSILNMASSFSPCGGYDKGAFAQEESLCYMSTLSYSLYQFGNPKKKYIQVLGYPAINPNVYPLDRNYGGIYTGDVTFFRHNESLYYALREEAFRCGVITVASLANREGELSPYCDVDGRLSEVGKQVEQNKIRTILRIGLKHGHDSLVLGAFGCGAYCLDPTDVAELFTNTFEEAEFKGKFKKVVFAIKENKGRGKVIGKEGKFKPFYDHFGQ